MIIADEIRANSQHPERDAEIINSYIDNGESQHSIARRFGLTQPSIAYIIKHHASLIISSNKNYDKLKRLNWLEKNLLQKSRLPISRTKLDLIDAKRKEFEGEGNINFISQFFTIRPPKDVKNRLTESIEQSNS